MNTASIFDPVRRKTVARTPEEEVRQALIAHLHTVCGAPYTLMSCEYSLKIGHEAYRADLLLFDRKGRPLLLAECKAPAVPITRAVFEQIMTYNQKLNVPYLLLTNGSDSYCCRYYPVENRFEALSQIPDYAQMLESV